MSMSSFNSADFGDIVQASWGGGTIFGHGVFFDRLRRRIAFDGKPYMVFGSGARKPGRPLKTKEREVLQRFCADAVAVGVRGNITKEWLQSEGVENVEIIGDVAVPFEAVDVSDVECDFKVGVCLRFMKGVFRKEEQLGTNQQNIIKFASICDKMVKKYGAKLYFFDLCENRFDSDFKAITAVRSNMTEKSAVKDATIFSFEENRDPVIAFSRLGKMDYVLSQRMHPSLMAWVQGVPSVGVEYQFGKTLDAFGPLGLESCVRPINNLSPSYMEMMDFVLENKASLISDCTRHIALLRQKQHNFLVRFLTSII